MTQIELYKYLSLKYQDNKEILILYDDGLKELTLICKEDFYRSFVADNPDIASYIKSNSLGAFLEVKF